MERWQTEKARSEDRSFKPPYRKEGEVNESRLDIKGNCVSYKIKMH